MADEKKLKLALLRDLILAWGCAVVVFVLILLLGVPGADPSTWDELAVAANVRPPNALFPGLWRVIAGCLFEMFGVNGAIAALKVGGAALAAVCSAFVYFLTRDILRYLVRTSLNYKVWRNWIVPFFAAVATLVFGMSDPLWQVAQTFSPSELHLLMLFVVLFITFRWFTRGGNWRVLLAFWIMGMMSAETPLAFVLPLWFVLTYMIMWHMTLDNLFQKPEGLPEPELLPKWRMFFTFLGGLAVVVWINASNFIALGGLEANLWRADEVYFHYGASYWGAFIGASSIIGWALGFGFAGLPMVVLMRVFPMVARDDRPMIFNLGIIVFFAGFLAFLQSGAFPSARFWTFTREFSLVHSGFLLAIFMLCAAIAIALFGAAFTMECQRKYLDKGDPQPGWCLRVLVPALTVLMLIGTVSHLHHPVEIEMQKIADDAIAETLKECGDAKYLFTDGHLDSALELYALANGRRLYTLNMMSGADDWETMIRCRGFEKGTDDFKAVETGVPTLLRIWAGEKPEGLKDSAIQLGFEFWKRDNRKMPRMSGLVAREYGLSEAEAQRGIEYSRELANRILKLSDKLEDADVTRELSSAVSAISWRLARLARLRSEGELAENLDLCNTALKKMLSVLEYERMRTFMQMTPREGLQFALRRADFAEARRYSAVVLRYDEDDPEANFAMGMSALSLNRLNDAERYLKKVLVRRPEEPAALNNLSIVCRKLQHYKEAEEYARHALKLLPESPEVKQTLTDALKKAP